MSFKEDVENLQNMMRLHEITDNFEGLFYFKYRNACCFK